VAGSGSSRSAEKLEVTPLPRLCVENITSFEGDCHGGDKLQQGLADSRDHCNGLVSRQRFVALTKEAADGKAHDA